MTVTSLRRSFLLAVSLLLLGAAWAAAENWPGWRGPGYNGISDETGLPTSWAPGKNIVWELDMPGPGGSTPAVWGDRIFVTSGDGKDVVLMCITTAGKIEWKKPLARPDRVYRQ